VKSHGGFINVYSEVGNGSTFKVYLPAITTAVTQKEQARSLKLSVGHGEYILVVDDEAQIREITRVSLEKNGYRVLTASDGAEAIPLYSQNRDKIKIVLMDMMMPVMDGPASINELREIDPKVRIIAVSGLTEGEKYANITDKVNAFLSKPYTTEKLLKTIHEVLNAKHLS
jgi:CheY-like chemotaxis protein